MSSEFEFDGYDLVRLNRSRRGGGVSCYIESSIAYSYTKIVFAVIPNIFLLTYFFLFVRHIKNAFKETGVLDKQECYLLGDLNKYQSNPWRERNLLQQKL